MNQLAMLLASVFSSGTVLALAALGLLINEKSGVINLGAEGLMLCAALAGFAVGVHTGNGWLGFAAGMAAGAVLAGLLGVLVIWLNANQYAAGLALSLFGAGLSAFMGTPYTQASLPAQEHFCCAAAQRYSPAWAGFVYAAPRGVCGYGCGGFSGLVFVPQPRGFDFA